VQADMEKPKLSWCFKRCRTRVVFPDPEGAQKMMAFPIGVDLNENKIH